MDSELDASKTFEVSEHLRLCDSCRLRFERESAMDGWMRESLGDVQMPADLWEQIEAGVKMPAVASVTGDTSTRRPRFFKWFGPLAMAAMVAIVITAGLLFRDRTPAVQVVDVGTDRRVRVPATHVSVARLLAQASPKFKEFPDSSTGEGGDAVGLSSSRCAEVRRQLADMSRRVLGAEVTFEPSPGHRHPINFVAVFERTDDEGDPYIELHMNCCGRPTLIALALTDSHTRILELNEPTAKRNVTDVAGELSDVPIQIQSESINGVMVAGATARHYLDAVFAGFKVSKI
ncbi:MAG: hypothetical protein DHS20C16_28380 [Phycisphaerae bacterium]|nr:MAG: hypothetical protein DHS20C16_28380 [Phycisphaerae bacterium]